MLIVYYKFYYMISSLQFFYRFPLRSMPSPLSDLLYTHDRAELLFQSFQHDSYLLPLFLNHLEKVSLKQNIFYCTLLHSFPSPLVSNVLVVIPRRFTGGGIISVRPSVRPSVCPSGAISQKLLDRFS